MHLAHPLGVKGFDNRWVKNDLKDATLLADLLRMGSLPEARIAPNSVWELWELVRYRSLFVSRGVFLGAWGLAVFPAGV